MHDDLYALAPPGTIYVCGACGRTSHNRAGFWPADGTTPLALRGQRLADPGWDSSCMTWATLCKKKAPGDTGPWQAIPSSAEGA